MRMTVLLLAATALGAAPACAQQIDPAKVEIKVEQLAPGVAVLFGAGGNIGLSHGVDGNVLVDDQYAPLTDKIVAAVKRVDPDPVKFVVNTHWHGDHSGGNENLGKAGAVIVAHENVRRRMSVDQFSKRFGKTAASPKAALPVVTFGQGVTLNLNGDEMQIVHVRAAHTDGDSLVYWKTAKVLHMGDTFFHKVTLPFIDLDSGGTIDGAIAAVRTGLSIAAPDAKIIPGHGPVATRAELEAYLAMLVEVRDAVAAAKASGRTLAQVKAANPAKRYEVPKGFIMADGFVEAVYNSLAATPALAAERRLQLEDLDPHREHLREQVGHRAALEPRRAGEMVLAVDQPPQVAVDDQRQGHRRADLGRAERRHPLLRSGAQHRQRQVERGIGQRALAQRPRRAPQRHRR